MTGTRQALTLQGHLRARFAAWPYDAAVTQIILLDHHMVPDPASVRAWVREILATGAPVRAVRTGAMFPAAAAGFVDGGFHSIDTLALLEAPLGPRRGGSRRTGRGTTERLRAAHLPDVAALDRRAFGDPWGNDVRSLDNIADATPRHRSRIVGVTDEHGVRRIGGFALTGHSGRFGYLQRLAVDPEFRRSGIARRLVDDSMQWMRRRGATTAMVNTALDNEAALALYAQAGFRRRHDTLTILELSGEALDRCRTNR